MATKINADTVVGGAVVTADASGILELQSAGTTALTLSGANATFAGSVSLPSPLAVAGNSAAGAEIRLPEDTDNGSNYVALKAPNTLASNLTLTLPSADGTSGQFLQTNGSGTLSFASPATNFTQLRTFTSSGTFTAVKSGVHRVTVVGAGGSGAAAFGGAGGASGGGAGGYAQANVNLTAGESYTVTIGAGGTAVVRSTYGVTDGNSGGNSSFSGTGISTITANGGGGGQNQSSATGGTASGGDINVTGGGSGTATAGTVTGGGAVGVFGVGYSSGNATNSGGRRAASGGAGVGGSSGSVTNTTQNDAISQGGGSGGPSGDTVNASIGSNGPAITDVIGVIPTSPIVINGAGGPTAGAASGPGSTTIGAGSPGRSAINANNSPPSGGMFAGSGGSCGGANATAGTTAGSGGIGGGGGGVYNSNYVATSGAGGSGFVMVEW